MEVEPWAHCERRHCSPGAQEALKKQGTVLGWGMERAITELHDNPLGHCEVISQMRPEYTDSAVCGEGGIVHDSQPWSSSEEQGPSGRLEYYQGGVSPTTPWHLSVDDNGLGLSSFQRTRKWFLSSNESFNASNLGRGGTPLSFKYWEESLLSPLNDKMNIILKGKEDINLH